MLRLIDVKSHYCYPGGLHTRTFGPADPECSLALDLTDGAFSCYLAQQELALTGSLEEF